MESTAVNTPKRSLVLTEDLGKIFEMAICMLYETPFDGKYKYSLNEAATLCNRITGLKDVFPFDLKHIAKNGNPNDFECTYCSDVKLSAKTTKKDGKVCPQVIGQPSKKKFCKFFNIAETSTIEEIKQYIEHNPAITLDAYFHNTFDYPIAYYSHHKSMLLFIINNKKINWSNVRIEFSHKIKNKIWNESTTLIVSGVSIGEYQVHNGRDCIKFRWCFEKLLELFPEYFEVIDVPLC